MYSQQELDDAVASGVISAQSADALRAQGRYQQAEPLTPSNTAEHLAYQLGSSSRREEALINGDTVRHA